MDGVGALRCPNFLGLSGYGARQIFLQEIDASKSRILPDLPVESVTRAWINFHFIWHSFSLKYLLKVISLSDRHRSIGFSVKDQRRTRPSHKVFQLSR